MQAGATLTASSYACPNCGHTRIRRAAFRAYDSPGAVTLFESRSARDAVWLGNGHAGAARRTAAIGSRLSITLRSRGHTLIRTDSRKWLPSSWNLFIRLSVLQPVSWTSGLEAAHSFMRRHRRAGRQATGVEPSMQYGISKVTAGSGSVRILAGTADSLSADEMFDVVTLWDVVEHVEDPIELLLGARRLRCAGPDRSCGHGARRWCSRSRTRTTCSEATRVSGRRTTVWGIE